MKLCSTCKIEKPKTEFNRKTKNKDGLERYCKDCHRAHNRNHYANNAEAYKATAKKCGERIRKWYLEYKATLVCCRCGETKSWRLSFHHLNPKEKVATICHMVLSHMSEITIMKEIEKCIVVCHNCHSDIHYEIDASETLR